MTRLIGCGTWDFRVKGKKERRKDCQRVSFEQQVAEGRRGCRWTRYERELKKKGKETGAEILLF